MRSASSDQDQVSIYGAQRSSDHALTLVVINKTGGDLACPISVAGFRPAKTAEVYRYSAADLSAIERQQDQPVDTTTTGFGFTATYPANSITLIAIPSH